MCQEIIDFLQLSPGKVIVDATVGTGGHSLALLERIVPGGKLIGVDRDAQSLEVARERLRAFGDAVMLIHGNVTDLDIILQSRGLNQVDGMVFDLGLSSYQLDDAGRGFSFQSDGPLDMRMDKASYISAYDLVNNLNEDELSKIIRNFGQERWHNRIARYLVSERQKHPIATTRELSDIVARAIPPRYRHGRIHPATRTFQAVRIAVNRELEALEAVIDKAAARLSPSGRICIISFHSLEDRIVKFNFRKLAAEGLVRVVTPKPLTPSPAEVQINFASRSAKLRVAERQ